MRVWRICMVLWRYLFPPRSDRVYLRLIRRSGLFDRAFYLTSNPSLRRVFRLWPERHYVIIGEAAGLMPNPGFAPRSYAFHTPEVDQTGAPPLRHFIEAGQRKRIFLGVVPDAPKITVDRMGARAEFAIVVHLYYPEMWPEIAERLQGQNCDFDLFITLSQRPGCDMAGLECLILGQFPGARIWQFPNHGRDMFPFVHLAAAGLFDGYRAVCKLHGKKSPHRADGDVWRKQLFEGVLGEADQTNLRLANFLADPSAGVWVPDGYLYVGNCWWGPNQARAEALLSRVGLDGQNIELAFPAGSVFWAKPFVIDAVKALRLTPKDFDVEEAQLDGTTSHVLERLVGVLCKAQGGVLTEGKALDQPMHCAAE